ncbi:MAG: polysaccharide deacetylase family protein [Acidimicrobiales bacterium]
MNKTMVGGVSLASLALVANSLPATTAVAGIRRRLFPALAGQGRQGHLALTFDDGPDPSSTPAFLEALDTLGWKATFFLLGSMVRQAPELAVAIAEGGHEIGLHGDRHRNHLGRWPWAVAEDLEVGLETIMAACGKRPVWFRPPYGVLAASTAWSASQLGLRTVLWSAWGRDWRAQATAATVMADLETGLADGATVLLHDSDCTSAPRAWRSALEALPLLARRVQGLGWEVGTLSEHGIGQDRVPGAGQPPAGTEIPTPPRVPAP